MATSRRRERELARRRFERRRQAELERRAKAKRRNNVIGAVVGTVIVLGAIPLILWAAGVFSSSHKSDKAAVSPTTTPSATPSTTPTPAPPAPTKCAKITPNPPIKGAPRFPAVGKLGKKLVVRDLKVGHGRAAQKGDDLEVLYTGISCDTGKLFDSSYKSSPATPFPVTDIGAASVIEGWNKGLIGVKAGGERELIIPASEAYGASGSPPTIQGNDTLDFIVQVKSVKKGK